MVGKGVPPLAFHPIAHTGAEIALVATQTGGPVTGLLVHAPVTETQHGVVEGEAYQTAQTHSHTSVPRFWKTHGATSCHPH